MRTETFQTPGEVRTQLRLGSGEIRLESGESGETTVTLEALRDNDASREAVENARLELRERGGAYEVVVEVRDRGRGFSRGAEVRIEVRCPDGTSVEAKSGSADIDGRGRFGSIGIQTGSGDVSFEDVAGDVKIDAASGDIELGTVGGDLRVNTASGDAQISSVGGAAKVNSASGDVIVREARGTLDVNSASGDVIVGQAASSVSVNTASGDQQIQRAGGGKVTLKSASGDLGIGIPEGSTLWVDARSRSGEVRSELPVSDAPPEGGGPHVELRANTMSGDITVSRA